MKSILLFAIFCFLSAVALAAPHENKHHENKHNENKHHENKHHAIKHHETKHHYKRDGDVPVDQNDTVPLNVQASDAGAGDDTESTTTLWDETPSATEDTQYYQYNQNPYLSVLDSEDNAQEDYKRKSHEKKQHGNKYRKTKHHSKRDGEVAADQNSPAAPSDPAGVVPSSVIVTDARNGQNDAVPEQPQGNTRKKSHEKKHHETRYLKTKHHSKRDGEVGGDQHPPAAVVEPNSSDLTSNTQEQYQKKHHKNKFYQAKHHSKRDGDVTTEQNLYVSSSDTTTSVPFLFPSTSSGDNSQSSEFKLSDLNTLLITLPPNAVGQWRFPVVAQGVQLNDLL